MKYYKCKVPTMVITAWERDPRALRPCTGVGKAALGALPGGRNKQPEGWWALARWGG